MKLTKNKLKLRQINRNKIFIIYLTKLFNISSINNHEHEKVFTEELKPRMFFH